MTERTPAILASLPPRLGALVEIGLGMARRQAVSQATLIGAGAAFWLVLSVVPLLSATISVAGLLMDPYQAVEDLEEALGGVSSEVDALLSGIANSAAASSASLSVGLAISVGAALWSVGTGAMYLIRAVTLAYEQEETRGYVGLRTRGLLIAGAVVGVCLLALVTPNVITVVAPEISTPLRALLETLRALVTALLLVAALLTFYAHATPKPVEESRRERLPGAILAAALILVGTQVFAIYVEYFSSYASLYGAAAGIVIFMILMWLLVLFVLYGAILNAELRSRRPLPGWESAAAASAAAAAPGGAHAGG